MGRNARPKKGDTFFVTMYYDPMWQTYSYGAIHTSVDEANRTMANARNFNKVIPQFRVNVKWKGDCNVRS